MVNSLYVLERERERERELKDGILEIIELKVDSYVMVAYLSEKRSFMSKK